MEAENEKNVHAELAERNFNEQENIPLVFPQLVELSGIVQKVKDYQQEMKRLLDIIKIFGLETKLNEESQRLQFYIDKKAWKRMSDIIEKKECIAMGVFFGIDTDGESKGQVTASFLGIGEDGSILKDYYKTGDKEPTILGDEHWPPPPYQVVTEATNNGVTIASTPIKNFLMVNGENVPAKIEAFFKPQQ